MEQDPNPFQARILALSAKLYIRRLNNFFLFFFLPVIPLMQRRDRIAVDGNELGKTCFLPIDSAVTLWKRYSQQVSSFAWPSSRRARFLPAIRQLGNNPVTSRRRVLCSPLLRKSLHEPLSLGSHASPRPWRFNVSIGQGTMQNHVQRSVVYRLLHDRAAIVSSACNERATGHVRPISNHQCHSGITLQELRAARQLHVDRRDR